MLERTRNRFNQFFKTTASSSTILLITTIIALIWSNSHLSQIYFDLWENHLSIALGSYILSKTLSHWINDGLMAIFFLIIGLEIKREFMVGELSEIKDAILPFFAAIGGMGIPALIYIYLNQQETTFSGWGIPMATDIAFALGILSLLGNKIPLSLKVFLTATAIIDDLGAIFVIAIFYTNQIAITPLLIAIQIFLILVFANRLGVKRPIVYSTLGIALWLAVLSSGLHATIAGVLLAITVPARSKLNPQKFITDSLTILESFETSAPANDDIFLNKLCIDAISNLEENIAQVEPLIQKWERELHNFTSFIIIPLFALVNSGVNLSQTGISSLTNTISLGIITGLVLGKPIGITFFSWLAIKLKIASLPQGITWKHIVGVGFLGGIGFTMSIFISSLAFKIPNYISNAKIGVITASIISGIIGIMILKTLEPVTENMM
ncbi:Na+/H+ antiporter NhaA [Candidatus Bathyarchaeota archaeon]|nr:Na+/H+ antiporter NhaA [Candidatus Bathyarchaeota archaeon]